MSDHRRMTVDLTIFDQHDVSHFWVRGVRDEKTVPGAKEGRHAVALDGKLQDVFLFQQQTEAGAGVGILFDR